MTDAPYLSAWQNALGALDGELKAQLEANGLPTKRMEDWRFIRLNTLERTSFACTTDATPRAEDVDAIAGHTYEDCAARLVFVNGLYNASLSTVDQIEGVTLDTSGDAALSIAKEGFANDHFALLNDALGATSLKLSVAKNTFVSKAIHVLFVNSADQGISAHPRLAFDVGAGSKISVVEEHLGFGEQSHWSNVLVEATLADNARLNHVKLQRENTQSFHIARTAVRVNEGAHYASMTATFGAALSRHDLWADIQGGNTTCELHGLAVVSGRQVADTHSTMNHDHAHSMSDQLHKCIVDDRAHAVFNGKIVVQQDAQQINAFQLNRNLLLSNSAKVDTKPQLEIFADDVKCSHGATIGQLDEDQLFYLQSRGITPDEGRVLLTYAFAAELVERVPVLSVRKTLEALIADHIRSN